ncbi:hypothetical protein GCM10009787_26950 [Streptomyces bangladeshensis]|uniref:Uncharacterized protein n=1 Tax=Streptomyces bangladeshensis TaxID=295352 RepID=A0ABN3BHM3_9ACTN
MLQIAVGAQLRRIHFEMADDETDKGVDDQLLGQEFSRVLKGRSIDGKPAKRTRGRPAREARACVGQQ